MKCLYPLLLRTDLAGSAHYIEVPCGRCIACRVNRSNELIGRLQSEFEIQVSLGMSAYFVTLTYNDDNLPSDHSLRPSDVTAFNKRMKYYYPNYRYFCCGEYGHNNFRPHYHLICFCGCDSEIHFRDLVEKIWDNGYSYVKSCHRNSVKYVCKYVTKFDDRNIGDRKKPFVRMSQYFGFGDKQTYQQRLPDMIKEIRSLSSKDKLLMYSDVLGKRHPFSRKIISKSFTENEKLDRLFRNSENYENYLYSLYQKTDKSVSFSEFRVAYENSRNESFELEYWKNNYYRKK